MSSFPRFCARFLLFLTIAFGIGMPAQATAWQCVTYARHVSDFEIRGNAHTWWASAEGRYARGSTPEAGAVMVLRPHGRMRLGHVAVVRDVVDSRNIRLNHANWSGRGVVDANVLAQDVSANNDWSVVKVWYGPINALGRTNYPVYGFIYPETPAERQARPVMAQAPAALPTPEEARVVLGNATLDRNTAARSHAGGGNPRDLLQGAMANAE